MIRDTQLNKKLPRKTGSLCPECARLIAAELYEEDGRLMIKKTCPDHGEFKDIYFSDFKMFERFQKYAVDGVGVENPQVKTLTNCPFDCGLCTLHYSHSSIVNLDLTNRCNMNCPICFANANNAGFVFEPDLEQVIDMLKMLRNMRPVPVHAVQFAGGEPTVYPRFFEAIRAARDLGFPQVQVATNGVKIAHDPTYAQRMIDAGMHTVYLQFDGFKESTHIDTRSRPHFLKEKLQAIENLRGTRPRPLATVLVPVIVRGVNDDEVGRIINFALDNLDVIRSINFQPVSFSGRINYEERIRGRYTTSDLVHDCVDQTDFLEEEDFYPVPVGAAFAEMVSLITGKPKLAFSAHPGCGVGAYAFKGEDGKLCGISRFMDVDGMFDEIMEITHELEGKRFKRARAAKRALSILKYVDQSRAPKGLNVKTLIKNVLIKGNKEGLRDFHWRVLFIGAMHFMDRYNYDIERVKRCVVHYCTPDGRLIPFCAYNTGPVFRQEVENKFGMTFEEYRNKTHEEIAPLE
ncbi:MAG: radical SAM protein [Thermoplasmata archaeon]|nr:radical SAM protein [Thermoplasmata archaeon]